MSLIPMDAPAWTGWVALLLGGLALTLGYLAKARRQVRFRRPQLTATNQMRLWMFAGCVGGGLLSALFTGGWHPTWSMGPFDALVSDAPAAKFAWMFVGGLLVGFGARLAKGDASGHAVFTVPFLDKASLRGTLAFLAAGLVVSNLLWRVLFR